MEPNPYQAPATEADQQSPRKASWMVALGGCLVLALVLFSMLLLALGVAGIVFYFWAAAG